MRISFVRSLVLVAAVAVPLAHPLVASAAPASNLPPDKMKLAEELWNRGAAAYSSGDYQTAITLWNQAYDISHEPHLQQQLALAYGHLGKAKEERAALKIWRDFAAPAERPRIDEQIKNLDDRIAQQDRDEKARADESERLKRQLELEQNKSREGSGFVISIPGVITGSVGVAAVIAGVAVDGAAAGTRPDPSKVCKASGTSQICLASAKDSITKGNTMAIAGDATWIIGAAAVAAGAVIIIVDRPHAKTASTVPVGPTYPPGTTPAQPQRRDRSELVPRSERAELELSPFVASDFRGGSAPGVALGGRF